MIPCPTWPRALLLAAALLLLVVAPAAAHPGVRGGELPVDSLATMTIATNHGCGTHDDTEEEVTTGLTLEVPDWLRIVDVPADGWDLTLEGDAAGRTEVVNWEDDLATEIAPEIELAVVATGTPGETRYLRVIQTCGELTERWVGTPDEPADQPAVRVALGDPDPDAPPPPPEDDVTAAADPTEEAAPATEEAADPPEEAAPATEEAAGDLAEDTSEVAEGTTTDVALDASPATVDDGDGNGWWLVALLAAVAVVAGFVAWRNRDGGAGA
jgi:uncharacterized protein YcnI